MKTKLKVAIFNFKSSDNTEGDKTKYCTQLT